MPSRRSWTAAGLLAACLLLTAGCSRPEHEEARASLSAVAEKADLPIEVELSGTFVADDKVEIRMEPKAYRGDLIITRLMPEGRAVEEGDVLIEFDHSSLEDSLEDARDEVKSKEVALAKARAELEAWQIEEDRKRARREHELSAAKKDLDKETERAALVQAEKEKEVEDAADRLADAKVDLEQLMQLYEERELHTANEQILIEREKRKLENTSLRLVKSKREFELWAKYDRGREVEDKRLEHGDKQADIKKAEVKAAAERSEKESEVSKAERALEKAQKKVAELEADAGSLRVVSPRAGIVFYGAMAGEGPSDIVIMGLGGGNDDLEVGGRVRTFQVLMTVASMSKLSIQMKAMEADIQHLQPGLPIVIRPDAFPALAIDGELTKVDQIASRSGFLSEVREFTIRGRYEGSFPQLRSGMNCRVTVRANSIPDCIQVPVLAVFSEGEGHYCWVMTGGRRTKREVKIGASNGAKVEVTDGLRSGETVALFDPGSA